MDCTCVDSAIEQLSKLLLERNLKSSMENQIKVLLLDLRFVKLFCSSLAMMKISDEYAIQARSFLSTLREAGQGLYDAGYFAINGIDVQDWELLASNLLQTVESSKPAIRRICAASIARELDEMFATLGFMDSVFVKDIVGFIDSVLVNLKQLANLKADLIITPVKKQIMVLQEKLKFSRNFVDFTTGLCYEHDKFGEFLIRIQDWAKNAARLSVLYWVDGMNENKAIIMHLMLSDMLQKIMPYNPEVTEMYIKVLKASKLSRPGTCLMGDTRLMGQTLVGFVNIFSEKFVGMFKKDDIEILREGLIFVLAFLVDPPNVLGRGREDSLLKRIEDVISEVPSLISVDHNISRFLEKISEVKTEVREHYVNSDSPISHDPSCPKTNGKGFVNFLLTNLEEMMECNPEFICFAKYKVVTIHEALESLIENEDLGHLWVQTVNVAYRAQDVINSCSIVDSPIWSHIIRLSDVLKEIESIQEKVSQIEKDQKCRNKEISAETDSRGLEPSSIGTSSIDEVVVGFNDDADAIIRQLTTGIKERSIISIVGTCGVGKTTLAKKVYKETSVQSHFTKTAWCSVTQIYRHRELLLAILRCIASVEDIGVFNMDDEDLADKVRKCLMRQRYLIVMDDIWDSGAWEAIKPSLPDDKNGSRILLTSQETRVILGPNFSTYPLDLLDDDDKSWDLLKGMIFHNGCCPHNQEDVGKEIARKCGGLRLAIAELAILLKREKENLHYWKQTEESLKSGIDSNGCWSILELRYENLPDFLKPCFLYLGTFQKGKDISAQKLTLLWIAEGFAQSTEEKSSEVVAKEYLMRLIGHSLVNVSKRSSNGGIKMCRIHDLLHDFCVEKAKRENFVRFNWPDGPDLSQCSSLLEKYYLYRWCIPTRWESFNQRGLSGLHVYSLLVSIESGRNQSQSRCVSCEFFCNFKLLNVLNLENIYLHFDFPKEVMEIVHLRYLALQGGIKSVPLSIADLWNLRTFVVKGLETLICLPETIWMMKSLKNVHVSENAVISLGDYELEESTELNDIKTFSTLALHNVKHADKLLRRLSGLRKLRCVVSESQLYGKNDIPFPGFASLQNLESLALSTDGFQGRTSYSRMHIQFEMFRFPVTLKKLTLYKLGLPWRAMSEFQQLRNLEVLKLREQAFRGKLWMMKEEEVQFCNLKLLELSNLNIEEWNITTDPFPNLEQLVVRDCHRLGKIPPYFGVINELEMIELLSCSNEAEKSAGTIVTEQARYGVEIELRILRS